MWSVLVITLTVFEDLTTHSQQDTMEMCSKESEFKSILFSLVYFHAVIIERRKFGPQGWNRSYPFNTGDLTISVHVLYNYLEANPKVTAMYDMAGVWKGEHLCTCMYVCTCVWVLWIYNIAHTQLNSLHGSPTDIQPLSYTCTWMYSVWVLFHEHMYTGAMDWSALPVWWDYVRWPHHRWLGS